VQKNRQKGDFAGKTSDGGASFGNRKPGGALRRMLGQGFALAVGAVSEGQAASPSNDTNPWPSATTTGCNFGG
jgi:hypothetical protein